MDSGDEAEAILDRFVEGLFRLMLEQHHRNVSEKELTLPQAQVLKLLHLAPLSSGKLATMLGISAAAVTQLTDRLARKHLIERRAVENDRRSVFVVLTQRGTQVIEDFRQQRNAIFNEVLSRLSDPDRLEVIVALAKVAAALDMPVPREQPGKKGMPRRRPAWRQTAVQPAETSNEIRPAQQGLPPRRRMKIEWD